ncbi:hypothetical protein GCM10011452_38090 [Gemmobacter lanyuensis]|uniref:Uncharacterized protein n=1 Tax=Gemmobacter lanyuensis TaxID=1054497 RepID=A0A918MQQ1_9RHOB|nr:oligosaccharide flippase family protein [Gemmobacter lanyuensis]GGW46765.1 hypothetical protein GCM10011452_38090 [Gemmobacter lanyuensis]
MNRAAQNDVGQIRKHLRFTRIIVLLAFAFNAGTNVLLIGYFARTGGIDLVGHWAFLSAVALTVLILDMGTVNALTYRIAQDGVESLAAAIRRLLGLALAGAGALAVLIAVAISLSQTLMIGTLLAALSALLQLSSNWLVAIRMGQQQQYWFNVKAILRVSVQAICALIFMQILAADGMIVLGMALLMGGIVEFIMTSVLIRKEFTVRGPRAGFQELRRLSAGFGVTDISQRAYQPLSQLLVAQMLGAAAIGIFTVGLRIPAVVGQSLNEALRGLLPALSGMFASGNREAAMDLLRDSVALQLTVVVPAGMFLIFHADSLIGLWIGVSDTNIVTAVRIFATALILFSVATPFHWAAQAGGQAQAIGMVGLLVVCVVLGSGAVAMALGGNVLVFAAIYAAGQVAGAIAAIFICGQRLGLVGGLIKSLHLIRATLYLLVAAGLNFATLWLSDTLDPKPALLIALIVNAVTLGPLAFAAMRKGWI